MRSRSRGVTGPTASLMKVDRGRGTVGFTARDEADGARVTNAPCYYQRHERQKQELSEEDFKALIKCVLIQHYQGARLYRVNDELVQNSNVRTLFKTAIESGLNNGMATISIPNKFIHRSYQLQ